jgi:hypothetical protein
MGFASSYLNQRALFPEIVKEAPSKNTGIIVVIPAYNEPDICKLLDSLLLCHQPECGVEILIIVNAPEDAVRQSLENNKLTIKNIESWKEENSNSFFRLFAFEVVHSIKGWGVGLARKTGMDEAVRRFNSINNPNGIILSLDADCLVEKNYFVSVCNELLIRKERNACSIYFEHPLSGDEFPDTIYKYITLYELHLRYYSQCLSLSGFPYAFHTVGSASAVKALAYIRVGGMNRRQAGEDFYFIQKLVPGGGYFSLNSTTVFPSPRISSRAPFGTGTSIAKLSDTSGETMLTYNLQAFKELKITFSLTENIYYSSIQDLGVCYDLQPAGVQAFINKKEWTEKMAEIKNNTSSPESFEKRFFDWFNMFRIVKYLNSLHLRMFERKPVDVAALELMAELKIDINSKEPSELLQVFRKLEKSSNYSSSLFFGPQKE